MIVVAGLLMRDLGFTPERGAGPVAAVREVLDSWRDLEREWRQRPPLVVNLADYDMLLELDALPASEGLTETLEVAHAG